MIADTLSTLREAIALSQCAEDATEQEHIRITLSMLNGMLLTVAEELEYTMSKLDANLERVADAANG